MQFAFVTVCLFCNYHEMLQRGLSVAEFELFITGCRFTVFLIKKSISLFECINTGSHFSPFS